MQLTDAGLAISATGIWGLSDGEQAQLARAMAMTTASRVAIFGRCMSINRHVFVC